MTAQEAAKKQTRFYRWLAAIFATGGVTALGGLYFDDLKVAATSAGGGGMLLSLLGWAADAYSKKTSSGVADQVVDKLKADMEGMRDAHSKSAAAILNLATVLTEGDQERRKMHAANVSQNKAIGTEVHEIKEQLEDHVGAIEHIGEAVASLKEGWQKPQLKKPKPQ